jgi:branched-chain amino acid transport system ATP-binding protein
VETIAGPSPVRGSIRFHESGSIWSLLQGCGTGRLSHPEDKDIQGMSVMENLELGAHAPKPEGQEETFKLVYGLFPILETRKAQIAGTLSGGEQQMLAIGRALMSRPKLLMCDEPSLGLAPLVVKNIFKVIQQINQSGVGVLLVEQNVRAALGLANTAYVIENGRVAGHGPAKNLLDDERVINAYLGTA